ncbi:MAG: hypothetical protein ACRDSZ_02925 [Pseudonocardiaceae bacterium]
MRNLTFRRAWVEGATEGELADLTTEYRRGLPSPTPPIPAAMFIHRDILITSQQNALPRQLVTALHCAVSGRARPVLESWRDVDGTPIAVGCRVEQTGVDSELDG